MRITKRPLAGAALVAVVLLAGCGGDKASSPPEPVASVASTMAAPAPVTTSAPITTTAPATTAAPAITAAPVSTDKPDTAQLDQMLKDLDGQLAAGTKALNDATAAINGGEGDVTP